jgi:hypothetical protein
MINGDDILYSNASELTIKQSKEYVENELNRPRITPLDSFSRKALNDHKFRIEQEIRRREYNER